MDWAAAKSITLAVSGGASITIEGGRIEVKAPGTITVKAGKKSLLGAGKASFALPSLPQQSITWPGHTPSFSQRLDVYDIFETADLSRVEYRVKRANDRFEDGTLDGAGRAHRMEAEQGEEFEYLVGLSGDWGLLGDDGDARANDGSLHHAEHEEEEWLDEEDRV